MLKHFLTIIYRNFLRSKGYFLINLVGLAAGLTCTLLIYLWVMDELSMNKFHANDKNLYQILEHQQYAAELMTTSSTPGILAENLKIDFPEVKYASENSWINDYTLSVDDHNVKAKGYHGSEDYFMMFSFPLIHGKPEQVLKDQLSMVISRSLAKKIFGTDEDVIGKTIVLQHDKSFNVTGVFEDLPRHSSAQFDFMMSFEYFKTENDWVKEWGNNGPSCYVVLHDGADPDAFAKKIADYIKGKDKDSNVTLFTQKYSDRYLNGRWENGKQSGGRIEYVRLFSIIAVFILIIACINFMNLSTARATRKSKEVGIKKSVGAGRGSLILQYMSESIITSFLSLIIACFAVYAALPVFNTVTDKKMVLDLTDGVMLFTFIAVAVITGLLAGSYPALYLSGFKPAAVLKGTLRGSIGELWARKGLVVFQFAISVFLIVSVIIIYKQINYVQTQNLGYDKTHLIQFPREGKLWTNLDAYLKEVRRVPGVVNASSIGHGLLGQNSNTSGLQWEGKNPDDRILFENAGVNAGMLETLGVTMLEGRTFQEGNVGDTARIIFNEAAIKVMGLTDPIGKHINLWGNHDMEIIGVVKDFNFQSMHETINPLFFRYGAENTWVIMIRLEAEKEKEAIAALTELYKQFNPGFEFDYKFQDVEYARLYAAEQRVATLASYFATMAVVISCLGLFGLAAFTAERRLKEIGIRKALGSSSTNIVLLLSGDFTRMVLLSVLIGLPVGYWLLGKWLESFQYKIGLEIWYFVASGLVALVIAWITVASQAIRAARVNPVSCLRTE